MRRTILLLTLCLVTVQSYAGGRIVQFYTIQQLQELTAKNDAAQVMDWEDFFQRRMKNNRWYKGDKGGCEILFETDTYVYYGYPFHGIDRCDTNNQRKIAATKNGIYYYKTSKKELLKHFPTYKSVEGYRLRNIVQGNDTVLHPPLATYSIQEYTYAIADNKILVGAKYKREHQLFPVNARFITYYTYIDMHTLEVKPMP